MNIWLSTHVVVVAMVLSLGAVKASPLSSGSAQTQGAVNPVVQTQLSIAEHAAVSQSHNSALKVNADTGGLLQGVASSVNKIDIPISPALLLFGIALAAIGWMGRKRKKDYFLKD